MNGDIYSGNSNLSGYDRLNKTVDKEIQTYEYTKKLTQGFIVADVFLNNKYLDFFSDGKTERYKPSNDETALLRFYRISKIVYDPEEDINGKLTSVYSSLHTMHCSVALVIRADADNIEFFMAVRSASDAEVAGNTLSTSLVGNFPGLSITRLEPSEKNELLCSISNDKYTPKSLVSVSLIPSLRNSEKDGFVQGMEKFIGTMRGKKYTAVLLASSVNENTVSKRRLGFEELYSQLSPHSKLTVSYAHNETNSVNEGIAEAFSDSVNNSVSNTNGYSESSTSGSSYSYSDSTGSSFDGWSSSSGSSSSTSSSYTSGASFSNTVSRSTGSSKTNTVNQGSSKSNSDTDTTTLNFENKSASVLMERANKQLERFSVSEPFGMWDFCAYFFADDASISMQAANVYKALMIGQDSFVERAHINFWGIDKTEEISKIAGSIKYLKHPICEIPAHGDFSAQRVIPSNMINGTELPIVLGLPRKSVPGVSVVEMAEFGRSVVFERNNIERLIDFGNIYHMGVKEDSRVPMDLDLLSSHCFITGSSGSGKSYATYQLLDKLIGNDVKIMIIEPAKGEYKQVFGALDGIKIYTTDPNVYKMLHINPFSFSKNIHVLTHIEKLMQIFNASWALYAAMPAILKDAVVQAYRKCGWDVMNSVYINGICDHRFPTFSDVLELLPEIINSSDYSAESKGNYKGALITRVQSMTTGISGMIFESNTEITDQMLFDSHCIIDLSDIGSEETIALLMGVIIMKLGEYRQSVRKSGISTGRDSALRHVTVLEEAHNLLKRTNKDQSQEGANIVGKSVEMISNSIKEMRTYGEGFIIIDQSPMAVDVSAIENTSTKIIMNTPARDACEELSSTLSLNEFQSKELSRLGVGVAAVFQKGWLTPVLMKVDKWDNKYEADVHIADTMELCRIRGTLLEELNRQVNNNRISPLSLRSIVKSGAVDSDKKNEFLAMITRICEIMSGSKGKIDLFELGKIYIDMSNCAGLFDVIDNKKIYSTRQIEQKVNKDPRWFSDKEKKNLRDQCKRWLSDIIKAFPLYAAIDDENVIRDIIQTMLYYMSRGGDDNTSKYQTIFILMINGKI